MVLRPSNWSRSARRLKRNTILRDYVLSFVYCRWRSQHAWLFSDQNSIPNGRDFHPQPQEYPRVHFGLGKATRIDSIEIDWPSGVKQEVVPPCINRIFNVVEGGGIRTTNSHLLPPIICQVHAVDKLLNLRTLLICLREFQLVETFEFGKLLLCTVAFACVRKRLA